MTTEIAKTPAPILKATSGLEPTKAEALIKKFTPLFESLQDLKEQAQSVSVNGIEDTEQIAKARELRLKIVKVRTATESTRKEAKQFVVLEGKSIDGLGNLVKLEAIEMEARLREMEELPQRIEAERKEKLRAEREELLSKYEVDSSFLGLSDMPETAFNELLENSKIAFEAKKAEAERLERERIAKIKAEQERIEAQEAENKRLKARQLRIDEILKAEMQRGEGFYYYEDEKITEDQIDNLSDREFATAINKSAKKIEKRKAEIQRKKEADELKAAKQREKLEKERQAAQKKLEAERRAKEKLIKEKEEAKAKEIERERMKREEEKAARLAPDKEKLILLALNFKEFEYPAVKSAEAKAVINRCKTLHLKMAEDLEQQIAKL